MDDASRKYVRWIAARKARQQERDAEKAKMDHDKAVEKDRQTKIAATEQREKNAADALRGARFLLENGNAAKARERLEQVLKDYPGTAAAKEAEGLLKTLK
jgi:hypothetical protein